MYSHTDTPGLRAQLGIPQQPAVDVPFNVLVIGPKGVGKSTFAAHLGKHLGLRVVETSAFLMQELATFYADIDERDDRERSLKDLETKHPAARRQLLAMGHRLTKARPDCLLVGALAMGQVSNQRTAIIVGAKRKIELEAWFGNAYTGFLHRDDVLVEIAPCPPNLASDIHYELSGYGSDLSHGGKAKYHVPAEQLEVAAKLVAEKIEEIVAEMPRDLQHDPDADSIAHV